MIFRIINVSRKAFANITRECEYEYECVVECDIEVIVNCVLYGLSKERERKL